MKELLKSSRLVHYVFVFLSAAILLLALAPNHRLLNEKAIRQIEALKPIKFEDYERTCSQESKHVAESDATGIKSELIKKRQFSFTNDFAIWYPMYCSHPTIASPLSEIDDFFESQNEVSTVVVLSPMEGNGNGGVTPHTPSGMIWTLEHHSKLLPKGAQINLLRVDAPCLKQSDQSQIAVLEQKPDYRTVCKGTIDIAFDEPVNAP